MNTSQEQSVLAPSLRTGRMLVIAVIAISLLNEVVVSLLDFDSFSFGRFLATVLLLYLLYEGYGWARWLIGALLGLAGLGEIALGFATITRSPRVWLVIGIALLDLACMVILFFSKTAIAFLEHKKTQPKR